MLIGIIIIIGLLSTFIMTVLMQLLGYRQRKSIPWLLGTFISLKLKPTQSTSQLRLLAWGNTIHYFIGIAFVAVYFFLWYQGWLIHSYFSVLIFGILAGILAVIVWFLTLSVHPLKAFISYRSFLLSIFISHLVFAFSMASFIDICMIFFLDPQHFFWMYV
jgi:hypothetical protein